MVEIIVDIPMPKELKMDGAVDVELGIEYWGIATLQDDGTYRCLANVRGVLCVVEVNARPKQVL